MHDDHVSFDQLATRRDTARLKATAHRFEKHDARRKCADLTKQKSLTKQMQLAASFKTKYCATVVRDLGARWTEALARADSKRGRLHAVCCGFVLERLASTAYAQPQAALGGKRPKTKKNNEVGGCF